MYLRFESITNLTKLTLLQSENWHTKLTETMVKTKLKYLVFY